MRIIRHEKIKYKRRRKERAEEAEGINLRKCLLKEHIHFNDYNTLHLDVDYNAGVGMSVCH